MDCQGWRETHKFVDEGISGQQLQYISDVLPIRAPEHNSSPFEIIPGGGGIVIVLVTDVEFGLGRKVRVRGIGHQYASHTERPFFSLEFNLLAGHRELPLNQVRNIESG